MSLPCATSASGLTLVEAVEDKVVADPKWADLLGKPILSRTFTVEALTRICFASQLPS